LAAAAARRLPGGSLAQSRARAPVGLSAVDPAHPRDRRRAHVSADARGAGARHARAVEEALSAGVTPARNKKSAARRPRKLLSAQGETQGRKALFGEGQRLHAETLVEIPDLAQKRVELALQSHQRLLVERTQRLREHAA